MLQTKVQPNATKTNIGRPTERVLKAAVVAINFNSMLTALGLQLLDIEVSSSHDCRQAWAIFHMR
eukprot:944030-Amphidinium_carterae.4